MFGLMSADSFLKVTGHVRQSLHFISGFVEVSHNARPQLIVLNTSAAMSSLSESCAN